MTRSSNLALILTAVVATAAANAAPGSENKDFMARHYPAGALAKGEQGKVGFKIDIDSAGRIERCAVTESSGYATLDRETCDFIVVYASFGAAHDGRGQRMRSTKAGFINWTLPPGARLSAAPRMASATLPPPILCKRTNATGSIVAHVTHCLTEEEWARHDDLTRDSIEQMQGRLSCSDHGCVPGG